MEYGVNVLSVLPVRKEANHRSEMVNQLLFGEQFIVIGEAVGWLQIKSALDDYSGWITSGLVLPLDQRPLCGDPDPEEVISQAIRINPLDSPENSFLILPGSTLPGLDRESGEFNIGGVRYKAHGSFTGDTGSCSPQKLVQSALLFTNAPYLWGGRSLFGIDCSGLVQLAYKMCGISLPRDASQQVLIGEARSFASEAQPGELAFFALPEEDISHVGMIIEQGKIVHASGKVRIDSFDHQGIFNVEKKEYTHSLRVTHRYLPE